MQIWWRFTSQPRWLTAARTFRKKQLTEMCLIQPDAVHLKCKSRWRLPCRDSFFSFSFFFFFVQTAFYNFDAFSSYHCPSCHFVLPPSFSFFLFYLSLSPSLIPLSLSLPLFISVSSFSLSSIRLSNSPFYFSASLFRPPVPFLLFFSLSSLTIPNRWSTISHPAKRVLNAPFHRGQASSSNYSWRDSRFVRKTRRPARHFLIFDAHRFKGIRLGLHSMSRNRSDKE